MFTYGNRFFMYDANKNKILQLSSEAFKEINEYLRLPNYSSNLILSLKRKGFLLESNINKVEHFFSPFVKQLLDGHVSTLILQVTQNCNFACRYCTYVDNNNGGRTHNNEKMSFDIAKKSIDFVSKHCYDAKEIIISFYGGEPLLNFDLIKECVYYSKKIIYNKKINFYMTSNLYLATDDMIDFLAEHEFNLLISLDGPEHIQNNHRRLASNGAGTYERVIDNVKLIKNKHYEYFISKVQFNPVALFDEDPMDVYNFFETELNIFKDKIQIKNVDTTGLNIAFDPYESSINQQNRENIDFKTIQRYTHVLNDKSPITSHYHINGACVPGSEKLFVTVDGKFFPCEKVNESNENMQIGSLTKGFDYEKVKYLMNLGYMLENDCKKCWAIRFCNRCCANCDDGESSLSKTMLKNKCEQTKKDVCDFFKTVINHSV